MNKKMNRISPPNSWFKYIKYTDYILKNYEINALTLSNPFLYPIKPEYKILKDLDYLEKKSNLNYFKLRLKFYVYFLRNLYDILKQIFVRKDKFFINQKKFYKKEYDIIFISHLNNTNRLEEDFDEYFGNIINKLSKEKKILLLLIPHCDYSEKEFNKFIVKKRNYDVSILNKKLVNLKVKIKYLFEILKERKKFLKLSKKSHGINKKLLFMTGNYFLSPGNILYLMSYLQFKEIIKNVKTKNLITTFEGLAWESLFYYAAHKSKQNIRCIGFQHTLLFKYQHSITRSIKEIFDPNLILCAGETSAKILKKKIKNKKLSIKVLGSPMEEKKYFKIKSKKKNIILFLPSGDPEESKYMTRFAMELAKSNKKVFVVIRYHPIMINKLNNVFYENLENISISYSSLEDDSNLAKWAIYSSSTAIFKAIMLGCIPLRIHCNLPTDFCDPLWQLKSNMIETIFKLSDLENILLNSYQNKKTKNIKENILLEISRLRSHLNLKALKREI